MARSDGFLVLLLLAAVVPGAAPARAQDEFLLNDDRVDRNQWSPQAARGSSGAIVVVWMDGRNQSGDQVDFDTYTMTIRDPRGIGSTLNRRVNDDPPGVIQGFPDIDGSPAGTFFVAWEDGRAGNRDIYGATLDSVGLRVSPNLRINDDELLVDQSNPAVAAVGPDRFLVVWGDLREGKGEIYASYRTSLGAPIGPNFKISSDPVAEGSYQGEPALAARADGSALVAWLDGREGGSVFGATFDVYGQLLSPAGQPVGGNFKLNGTTGAQRNTSVCVAADASLGYAVGWVDRRNSPGDPGDIYAQRVAVGGGLVGGNVRVNDDAAGRDQRSVRALAAPGAAYLIWEDLRGNLGIDGNVQAARVPYDTGAPGVNFRVNASLAARQGTPGAVWDGRDAILAVWEDGRNGAPDIYAISILPDGTRRGTETQLNDDAARGDQRRPRLGRGPGRYLATWFDRRTGTSDLWGQWVTSIGGRDGPNHMIVKDDAVNRPVSATAAVAPNGSGLVAAHVTRDSDAGEIRGFLYTATGLPPTTAFWISDQLPSAQSTPALTASASGFAAAWLDTREGAPRVYGQRFQLGGARVGGNQPLLALEPEDPVAALDLDADPRGGYWLAYATAASIDPRLWIVHLGEGLAADRSPIEVAPGVPGARSSPRLGVASNGRVEVAWLGSAIDGLGVVHHQCFDSTGTALGPPAAIRPAGTLAVAAPALTVASARSMLTWESKEDGNWSVWLQGFDPTGAPLTGLLRVDQDISGADQLDPQPGIDEQGKLIVIWSDARSVSSGLDILGRVYSFTPTSVVKPPEPPPAPEPSIPPPTALRLGAPRPNPFSGALAFPVEAPVTTEHVSVRVLDARGRLVATLHAGPLRGERDLLHWDGKDRRGHIVASGVYWIVAETKEERRVARVVQLR